MKPQTTRKRPKSRSIQTIKEIAPWVRISEAAEESGLTELQIRQSKAGKKQFGNADYVSATELNVWILGCEKDGGQVKFDDSIAEISAGPRPQCQHADLAMDDFIAALPILGKTLAHSSAQSAKVLTLLESCWSGELCDNLASLDPKVANAIIAMIAARAICGRDADLLLRHLINCGESQR